MSQYVFHSPVDETIPIAKYSPVSCIRTFHELSFTLKGAPKKSFKDLGPRRQQEIRQMVTLVLESVVKSEAAQKDFEQLKENAKAITALKAKRVPVKLVEAMLAKNLKKATKEEFTKSPS